MKFIQPCLKCIFERKDKNFNFTSIEMNDSNVYKFQCDRGHETNLFLQDNKFEILFDLGALALIDGYTREAVSSFIASLERFYEFFIQVLMDKRGIDSKQYESTWKLVKNQSERQLGAFYFLYFNEYNETPPAVNNKSVEFRNNVIHKGYIPTYDETYNYGKYIYEYIKGILIPLKQNYFENIINLGHLRQELAHYKNKPSTPFTITAISYMLPITEDDELFSKRTFEKSIEALKHSVVYKQNYYKE